MSFSGHKGVKKHNDFLALGMGSMQVLERHYIKTGYSFFVKSYKNITSVLKRNTEKIIFKIHCKVPNRKRYFKTQIL